MTAGRRIPFMSLEDTRRYVEARDDSILPLDVRERDAYLAGHLPGAHHIPRGELELINIRVALRYRVREDQLEEFVLHGDRADALIGRVAESVLAEWVAGRDVDRVLLQGQTDLGDLLAKETQRRLEPYQIGVEVQQANVAHLFDPQTGRRL